MCLCTCLKEGNQIAASDRLIQLQMLYAQDCTVDERLKKRESRSMLDAVCLPPLGNKYISMPYKQKCMSASIQGCVFCVQGRAVGCSLLALVLLI